MKQRMGYDIDKILSYTLTAGLLVASFLFVALPGRDVQAQAPPSIVYFDTNLLGIDLAAAEAGETTATFSWLALHLQDTHSLDLQAFQAGEWVSVLSPDETSLAAMDSLELPIQHSQTFASPTYRLVIQDAKGELLSQQFVVIPYEVPEEMLPPEINFAMNGQPAPAAEGTVSVDVQWQVTHRLPTAHLRFVQVLPDGSETDLSLADHEQTWVPSQGEGRLIVDATASQLVLVVENLATQEILGKTELALPPAGSTSGDSSGLPDGGRGGSGGIIQGEGPPPAVTASVTPQTAQPGETITIRWMLRQATSFTATVQLGDSDPVTLLNTQELGGTFTYTLPPGDYSQARFTLTLTNESGISRSRVDIVTVR